MHTQRILFGPLLVVSALAAMLVTAPPSRAERSTPLPLGIFTPIQGSTGCPPEYKCRAFSIAAWSNVQATMTGAFAQAGPPRGVPARGMVVFFAGSTGMMYWNSGGGIAGD